jgi:hypothetical protein
MMIIITLPYFSYEVIFILFFVQTSVDITGSKEDVMSYINISTRIGNALLPNLPISYAGSDYKNDCYALALTSNSFFELAML